MEEPVISEEDFSQYVEKRLTQYVDSAAESSRTINPRIKVSPEAAPAKRCLALELADRILEVLEESGASETEKYAALGVVRNVVPILPGATCSAEKS